MCMGHKVHKVRKSAYHIKMQLVTETQYSLALNFPGTYVWMNTSGNEVRLYLD